MADFSPPNADSIGEIDTSWDVGVATDRRLTEVYEFWRNRCRDGVLPSRADIDPTRLAPRLLPFLFLVEVLDEPRDFRFRLAGTHFRDFTGAEATGRWIAEVFPPGFADEVRYHWSSCVERKAPKLGSGNLWVPEKNHIRWEGIVLPLSPDGDRINMLLGAVIFSL